MKKMQATKKIEMGITSGTENEIELNDKKGLKTFINKVKNLFRFFNVNRKINEEIKMEKKELKNFNKKVEIRKEEFNSQIRAMMFVR